MRYLTAFLVFFLLAGAVYALDGEPTNIRLRAEFADSTITFRLQWNAPPRGSWDTPIEGYEWEIRATPSLDAPGTVVANGVTGTAPRRAEPTVVFDCSMSPTYYIGRVRALGNFSDAAPWGSADPFTMTCNDSPPGPPTVDLDTIPADTTGTVPDSLVLLPVDLGRVMWSRETQTLGYTSLGDVARLCAFAYRGGTASLTPRGFQVATVDSMQVVTDTDVLQITDANPLESACWDIASVGNGSSRVHLCTTDPAVCGALAGFGLPVFPAWMRWPLLVLGLVFIVFGRRIDRLANRAWRKVRRV